MVITLVGWVVLVTTMFSDLTLLSTSTDLVLQILQALTIEGRSM